MTDTTVNDLQTVLREEREILLRGDFAALEPIAEAKETLFTRLGSIAHRIAAPELKALKDEAEHNRQLLAAAARGLKIVTRRLAEIRSAHGPLNTYSEAGKRQTFGAARGALERRA